MSGRNRKGKFISKLNLTKNKRIQNLVFNRNDLKIEAEITNVITDPVNPITSSQSDHSYFQVTCNDESVPFVQNEIIIDSHTDSSISDNDHDDSDFDIGLQSQYPSNLLPLNYCRFICELDYISQQLQHCPKCDIALHLHNALGVKPYGVSGILYVKCTSCENVARIKLGKTHHVDRRKGVGTFDINTKTAAGMIHAGIGETQLNNLFASMNVHCPHHKSIKERENEVGNLLEKHAAESEKKFLLDEAFQSMTIDAEGNEQTGINVSTDTCWQRKGSGRAYNSLSGVASMIGEKTGKIVHHAIRISGCRICKNAALKGRPPVAHNCRMNWTGSAKGMEPDMVVNMVTDVHNQGIPINELAGDDDSTGFDRAKKLFPESKMEKTSDRNHIIINATKKLYTLKSSHKELTPMVINAITKNYSYVLAQNQGNQEGIEKGVKGMIDHIFGSHTYCNIRWCGYLKNRTSYKHTNLPHGKDLSSLSLKADLEKIFLGKIQSLSKKLSKLASSQGNESFNHTLSTKAAKNKHYSGSSSLHYRVSATVLQKNEGYGYVAKINEEAGLSPGNETEKRALMLNKKRQRKVEKSKTKEFKKKRITLKKERSVKSSGVEIREGRTYESEIGIEGGNLDEEIPPPKDASHVVDVSTAPLVAFDLETTSLSRAADIVQIAATSNNDDFSSYIYPNQRISVQASEITKITVSGNQMFFNLHPVEYKLQHRAFTDFISYLSKFPSKPVLIGHNIKRFDCHVLYNSLRAHKMWNEFASHICGFIDSLELFKKTFPGLHSYSQTNLVSELLGESYTAHNAIEDTRALLRLVTAKANTSFHMFAFDANYPHDCILIQDNLKTFNEAILCKALSKTTALKAAKSNLKLSHMKMAIERNGLDGLTALLAEPSDKGNVRVSSCKKVIRKIFEYLTPES